MNFLNKVGYFLAICFCLAIVDSAKIDIDLAYKLIIQDQIEQGNNRLFTNNLAKESTCNLTCPAECKYILNI